MTRLTRKALNGYDGYYQECCDKLGQLEDLEEKLGIDLITLINIFDKGFYAWVKDEDHEEPYLFHFYARDLELCTEGKSLIVYDECSEAVYGEYDFKDYGKIWALTEEELEDENC